MDYAIALGKLKRFAMKDADGKPLVEEEVRIPIPAPTHGYYGGEREQLDEGDGMTTATRVRFEKGDVYLYGMGRVRDGWRTRSSGRAKCRMCMVPKGKGLDEADTAWGIKHGLGKLLGATRTERMGCTTVTATMQMNQHATGLRFIIQANWRKPYPYAAGNWSYHRPGEPDTDVCWAFDEADISPMSDLLAIVRGFVAGAGHVGAFLDAMSDLAPPTPYGTNESPMNGLFYMACDYATRDRWDDESPVEPVLVMEALYAGTPEERNGREVEARGHKFHIEGTSPFSPRIRVPGVGVYSDFWAAWKAVLAEEERAKAAAEAKAKQEAEDATFKSFRVMVQTAGDGDHWSGNGMRYSTRQAAEDAGYSLACRWTAVKTYKVEGCQDEPNDNRTSAA